MNTVSVIVVTPDGVLRNSKLLSQFREISKNFLQVDFRILSGFDGRKGDFPGSHAIDQEGNVRILGRELKPTESACLLSHAKAISQSKTDWLIVLEDDMEFVAIEQWCDFVRSLRLLRFSRPAILLLYKGQKCVSLKRSCIKEFDFTFSRVLSLPTTTRAYAINLAAVRIVQNQRSFIGAADWPTWSSDIFFYQTESTFFRHRDGGDSYVAPQTSDIQDIWPRFRSSILIQIFELIKGDIPKIVNGRNRFVRLFVVPRLARILYKLDIFHFFTSN